MLAERTMPPPPETIFIARQPVLDNSARVVGFELLFRSADSLTANVTDELYAAASVMLTALADFGFEDLLGKHKGFINVNVDMLMSEALELLPKDKVVIELLESISPTDEVVERCRHLKSEGFALALDDHSYCPSFEPLYGLIDIVKIDILAHSNESLAATVVPLKKMGLRLLAEKVETDEHLQFCRGLGFELYQGYYFARPTVLNQRRVDISSITLMKLLGQVLRDVEIKEIEETFKQNPNLIFNLLRLVNSVFYGMREKIRALRHALVVLGREQLKRWILLALFAAGEEGAMNSPLMELAALRGRLMELLVDHQLPGGAADEYGDCAFMTGVLSMVDVLFAMPMDDVISHLNLAEDVRLALVERTGELGALLQLAEKVEHADFAEITPLLGRARLTPELLSVAQLEAIRWVNNLGEFS